MEIKEYLEKAYKLETEYLKHYYAKNLLEDEIEELESNINEIKFQKDKDVEEKRNELKEQDDYYRRWRYTPSEPRRTYKGENAKKEAIGNRKAITILFNIAIIYGIILLTINNDMLFLSIFSFILIVGNLLIQIYFTWKLLKIDEYIIKEENEFEKKVKTYKKNIKEAKNKDIDHIMKLNLEYEDFIKKVTKKADKQINKIKEEMTKLRELKKKESTKLTASKKKLKSLYENDILFEKYKNICAISSFLEYYESERTDTLTGQNGAYNIYENELSNKSAMKTFYFDYSDPFSNYQEAQYYLKSIIDKLNKYMNNIRKEMHELTKQS